MFTPRTWQALALVCLLAAPVLRAAQLDEIEALQSGALLTRPNAPNFNLPPARNYLMVNSVQPWEGVSITIAPGDKNGMGTGKTPLARVYDPGTAVTLTAPATAPNGNVFLWWQDGTVQTLATTLTRTLSGPAQVTAVYGRTTRTLKVVSQEPWTGVMIGVSPADAHGQTDGATVFTREYAPGTAVTLTAPATAPNGNTFLWWQQGTVQNTARVLTCTVTQDALLAAVYAPATRTLTVTTRNPETGVPIAVSPADQNGSADGVSVFTRTYVTGTAVTLTAAATAPHGNTFLYWLDGTVKSTAATLTHTLNTNAWVTAVYGPPSHTLKVNSSNPDSGVSISLWVQSPGGGPQPLDPVRPASTLANGVVGPAVLPNVTTPYSGSYAGGSQVGLYAPPTAGANTFLKWQQDGVDLTTRTEVLFMLNADTMLTAVYGPALRKLAVATQNPPTGVTIAVSPADANGNTDGVAFFTRLYTTGTDVVLTAPASAPNGNSFLWWLDGTVKSTAATLTHTVTADAHVTAVYGAPPRTLTVNSSNPDSGVSIYMVTRNTIGPIQPLVNFTTADSPTTFTTHDPGSANPGSVILPTPSLTPFTNTFENGTLVLLRAPAWTGNNAFQKWVQDGVDVSTKPDVQLTLSANTTLTAVFGANQPPVVASPLANPNPAYGRAMLAVTAYDPDNGPKPLSYTWSQVAGPGTPVFGKMNGTDMGRACWVMESTTGTYTFQVDVTDGAATVTSQTVSVDFKQVAGSGLTNGHGIKDILWRGGNGEIASWFLNLDEHGKAIVDGASHLFNVPLNWKLVGRGDLDGDGIADWIWRAPTGEVWYWKMGLQDGQPVRVSIGMLNPNPVPAGWKIAGVADLNGDGLADLVWRGPDGSVAYWLTAVQNGQITAQAADAGFLSGAIPAGWEISGVADLNGDGTPELVWRGPNGGVYYWKLGAAESGGKKRPTLASTGVINANAISSSWQVVGATDVDNDGRADLLWQGPTGAVYYWKLGPSAAGTPAIQSVSAISEASVSTYWQVVKP